MVGCPAGRAWRLVFCTIEVEGGRLMIEVTVVGYGWAW